MQYSMHSPFRYFPQFLVILAVWKTRSRNLSNTLIEPPSLFKSLQKFTCLVAVQIWSDCALSFHGFFGPDPSKVLNEVKSWNLCLVGHVSWDLLISMAHIVPKWKRTVVPKWKRIVVPKWSRRSGINIAWQAQHQSYQVAALSIET